MALIDDLVLEMSSVLYARPNLIKAITATHHNFEAWFCAEFVEVLERLKCQSTPRIAGFIHSHPAGVGQKAIDFTVRDASEHIALEFKACPCWTGGCWPSSYLTKDPDSGVGNDVPKLLGWNGSASYLVAMCYENPQQEKWDTGLRKFLVDFPGTGYTAITDPTNFPSEWFIGVLRLK